MAQIFIPTLGQHLKLRTDWTFPLQREYRNRAMSQAVFGDVWNWATNNRGASRDITIPADSILSIDRIYIRQGNSEFNSVTFLLKETPDNRWGTKRIRFWAKLAHVNGLQVDWIDDYQIPKKGKKINKLPSNNIQKVLKAREEKEVVSLGLEDFLEG